MLLLVPFWLFISARCSRWPSACGSARINVRFRDVKHTLPFMTAGLDVRLAHRLSAQHGAARSGKALYRLNPMVGVIEGFRWAMFGTRPAALASRSASACRSSRVAAGRRPRVLPQDGASVRGRHMSQDIAITVTRPRQALPAAAAAGSRTTRSATCWSHGAKSARWAPAQDDATARNSGRCATPASTSRTARTSASSASTAPARARCSRSCRASRRRRPAAARINGRLGALLEVGTGFHARADRPRERVPLRLDPRHAREEVDAQVRRHRRLLRDRRVHRHAGQALLQRHVRAPGVRRRGASRARHPAARRSAGGRRPRVPAQVHRASPRSCRSATRPSCSSRTTCSASRPCASA